LKSTSAVRSAVPGSHKGSINLCSLNACQSSIEQVLEWARSNFGDRI